MHILTKPLTIEDWLGNCYLVTPVNFTTNNSQSSPVLKSFKFPKYKERRSKMVKKIMAGDLVNKDHISLLLKSLNRQLNIELDLNKVDVYKLSSDFKLIEPAVENVQPQTENLSRKLMKEVSTFTVNDDAELVNDPDSETSIIPNTSANNDSRMVKIKKPKFQKHRKTVKLMEPDFPERFVFFCCFCIVDTSNMNYFFLPNDKMNSFHCPKFKSLLQISQYSKLSLERTLNHVELQSQSKIRFRSIIQSRRVPQLLYRKVLVQAKKPNQLEAGLHLLRSLMPCLIDNAVFYNNGTNLSGSYNLLTVDSKTNNRLTTVNYAVQNCLQKSLSSLQNSQKLSKIPVLVSLRKRLLTHCRLPAHSESYPKIFLPIQTYPEHFESTANCLQSPTSN